MSYWGSRMCCHYCWRERQQKVLAVVRCFSHSGRGGWGGEGFTGCEEHRTRAITAAMESMNLKDPTWRVTVNEVYADEDDSPRMHELYTARPKGAPA